MDFLRIFYAVLLGITTFQHVVTFQTKITLGPLVSGSVDSSIENGKKKTSHLDLTFPIDVFQHPIKASMVSGIIEYYKRDILFEQLMANLRKEMNQELLEHIRDIFRTASQSSYTKLLKAKSESIENANLHFFEVLRPFGMFKRALENLKQSEGIKEKHDEQMDKLTPPSSLDDCVSCKIANLGIIDGITRFCLKQLDQKRCAKMGFKVINDRSKLFPFFKKTSTKESSDLEISKNSLTNEVKTMENEPAPGKKRKIEDNSLTEAQKPLKKRKEKLNPYIDQEMSQ